MSKRWFDFEKLFVRALDGWLTKPQGQGRERQKRSLLTPFSSSRHTFNLHLHNKMHTYDFALVVCVLFFPSEDGMEILSEVKGLFFAGKISLSLAGREDRLKPNEVSVRQ
jgi:hypothetical protein